MKIIKVILISIFLLAKTAKSQVSVYAKVDHIVPDGVDTLGSISLTVSGSASPYTYTWNPGILNTKDINNVMPGQYTLNVSSASSQTYAAKYSIGYKVDWTNLYACYFRNDSLVSTATNYCRAVSKNTLAANTDGWVEYILDEFPLKFGFLGLVDSISPNVSDISDYDFGFRFHTSFQTVQYLENGAYTTFDASPKVGDVMRIERIGNSIYYKLNGTTVRTITNTSIGGKVFKLKMGFRTGGKVNNMGCSFLPSGNITFPNYINVKPLVKHSTGVGTNDGSLTLVPEISGTYNYTWQPSGTTTNPYAGLNVGQYQADIKNTDNYISKKYYDIGYKVSWTSLSACYFRNDSLVSTAASGEVSYAVSRNTLAPNANGWFEFVLDELPIKYGWVGFLDSISPDKTTFNDVDFGFRFHNSQQYIYYFENGASNTIELSPKIGDVFRLERVGNIIYYKLNGISLRSITVSGLSAKALKLKANLYPGFNLVNVGCSFPETGNGYFANYINAYPIIKHLTDLGANDGSIKSIPDYTASLTYTWEPSAVTTNPITGLDIGIYKVNMQDGYNNISSEKFNVGYKVNWTNMYQCTFRNDSLVSTTGFYYLYSKAVSKNTLAANTDGWFEFVLNALPTKLGYVGFLDAININANTFSDIDYGIYIYSDGARLGWYENGSFYWLTLNAAIGDIIRIERVGNTINYKINGITLRTVTDANIGQKTFKLKAALTNGLKLINLGCSFISGTNTYFPGYVEVIPKIVRSSGLGIHDGSITATKDFFGLKNFKWEPSNDTTATINSLVNSTHTVTVSDSSDNKSFYVYEVGYKTQWKNFSYCILRNDTLKGTGGNAISSYACTKNYLNANEDGWFEYVLPALPGGSHSHYIGFVDSSANSQSLTDVQYGFYYYAASKTLNYLEGTVSPSNVMFRTPTIGDVLRIERIGNTINYKVNGIIVRTITNTAISSKIFKIMARLYQTNYLANIGCSFTPRVKTTIKHVSCIGSTNGSITATTLGASSAYSYTWQPGNLSGASIDSLSIGTYTLSSSSATETPIAKIYTIGYKTRWQNLVNCSINEDTLKQTAAGATNTWSVGAIASNVLYPNIDGGVEYVVSSPFKNKAFGFLDSVMATTNYSDIDFGVYLSSNATLYSVTSGTVAALCSYEEGDIVRISRNNNQVKIKKNGILIWSSDIASGLLNKDWYVKASIYDYNAYLENLGCSFAPFDVKSIDIQDVNCVPNVKGIATANISGGQSPLTFNWNGSADTTSYKKYNLVANTYSMQVRDGNSCAVAKTFTVYNCPKWTNQLGSLTIDNSGDVIKTAGANSWSNTTLSTTEPFVFADTSFWISFNVADTLSEFMIGFRSNELDSLAQTTNYKLYVANKILTVIETDNDGFYNKREIAIVSKGNKLKIQITKEGIEYYLQVTENSEPQLLYVSQLFSSSPLIIENQIYKSGSRINKVRVSRYGNTY